MSALTSLLVRDQRVSVRKIEEAIQRQVIAGGGLDSVLLEMDLVPENVLAAYCAVVHGLLPATRDEVMRVARDTVRIVPRDVAERHRLVPLSMEDRTLLVAVEAPLDADVDQQLSFLLGADIVQRIVPAVRIAAALHHHYGVDMVPRMRRLANKLRERDAGEVPFVAPLEQNTAERVVEAAESDYVSDKKPQPDASPEDLGVVKAVPVENESSVRVGVAQVVGVRRSAPPPRKSSLPPPPRAAELSQPPPPMERRISVPQSDLLRKHRGPLTTRRASELISRAEERDEMLEVAFAFVRQFFDYTAVFVVHDGEAEGLDSAGNNAPSLEAFQRISIPLDAPSAFSVAVEGAQPMMTHLDASDQEREIRTRLKRKADAVSFIVPVAIKRRVVLLFFGDRSGDEFGLADVPELLAFIPKLSAAFQQLILRRKFRGYSKSVSTGDAVEPEAEPTWDPPQEPEQKPLRPGVTRTKPAPAKQARDLPVTTPEMPAVKVSGPAAFTPPEGQSTKKHPVVPPPDDERVPVIVEASEPPPAQATELIEESELVPGAAPRRRRRRKRSKVLDVLGVPRSAPPPPRPGSQPELFSPTAEPVVDPSESEDEDEDDDDDPDIEIEESDEELELDDLADEEVDFDGAPVGTYRMQGGSTEVIGRRKKRRERSRAISDPRAEGGAAPTAEVVRIGPGVTPAASPASRQPKPPGERPSFPSDPSPDTPSVIVSMGENVEEAVFDLKMVGPEDDAAITRVLNLGEAALPVLVREFPGTLWFDRNRPHRRLPRGRDISPHARVLAAFGNSAVPYIASLLDHKDSDARFYATLVASEVPHQDLVASLGRRVFDEDDGVAALAIDVLHMHRHFGQQLEKVLDMLRAAARVPRYAPSDRAAAARSLGELRDQRSVALLVNLTSAEHEELSAAAYHALCKLTRQDFGRVPRKWEEWLDEHGSKHRVEWLIDSLLHPEERIRTAAGEELKLLTQQYYGYHPAHPKKQREIAQKKYRDWWRSVGQARFTAPAAS